MPKHAGSRLPRVFRVAGALILVAALLAGARFSNLPPDSIERSSQPAATPDVSASSSASPSGADPGSEQAPSTAVPEAEKLPGTNRSADKSEELIKKRDRRLAELRDLAEEAADSALPVAQFRVASFNVLGASHSDGGNKPRFGNGASRAKRAAGRIRALGISVVALQEYEPKQHYAFTGATGWGVYPGMRMGKRGVRNSIAWNPAVWTEVLARHGSTPYFRGNSIPLPYVLLEHRETGRRAWFISIHNPTSNKRRGNNQHWRNVATAKQANLMQSLKADTGHPAFLLGDFNERGEAYCRVTAGGRAVAGQGTSAAGGCRVPQPNGIDWIFATPDVTFSGYQRDDSVRRSGISDHPLIHATATLDREVLGVNQ